MSKTIGTKEWAKSNVHFQSGCKAGCEYCYARMMANKFGWKKWDDWCNPVIRTKDVIKKYKKRNGVIMFPSSHNIDGENWGKANRILHKLVYHGNNVLMVMKPEFEIVKLFCESYENYKDQIEFRFTITTAEDSIRRIFEPNASSIHDRFKALEIVINNDFKASVSVEPFLDDDPAVLLELLWGFGSPPIDIWIGTMNHRNQLYQQSVVLREKKDYLENIYSPNWLKIVHSYIKQELDENIHFKDGFLKQMVMK